MNTSTSTTSNRETGPADLLALIADDTSVVSYRPRWNQLTGSITATILLQQLIYRWVTNKRRPFYKFARPCDHPLCRPGDTWEEELALSRREFEAARGRIATRTQGDIDPHSLISYWITTGHCTWYAINEPLLLEKLTALYPAADPPAVGIQLRLPDEPRPPAEPPLPDEPMPKSAIGDGENVQRQCTNPPSPLHVSAIGNPDPMYVSAIANGENVHQNYRDQHRDHQEQRSPTDHPTTATAPPAAQSPPAAAAAVDPRQAILDWIAFDDALTDKERAALDTANLLAWAYWVKLKQAERGSRVFNPVGLVRAQWRRGAQPRADLLSLARGWLLLSDDARGRLLGRLEWASEYGAYDPGDPLDDEFPDIPLGAAAAVYAATNGQLAPPALSPAAAEPVWKTERPALASQRVAALPRSVPQTAHAQPTVALWRDALTELEMQMTRSTFTSWLQGTVATMHDDELIVYCRNEHSVDWLSNRLNDLITRTVTAVAGRPFAVRYVVRQEAVP